MLNHISVDGFKSLTGFEMGIEPGLNILVGPNGSGKTNIISFLEFLGSLQQETVSDAICNAGGAGSLFTKQGEDQYRPNMICSVAGNIRLTKRRILFYRYSFTIGTRDAFESITFLSQRMQVEYRTVNTEPGQLPNKFDLDVAVKVDEENDRPSVTIDTLNRKKVRTRYPLYLRRAGQTKRVQKSDFANMIAESIGVDEALIHALRFVFDDWHLIYNDLQGGKVFNIVPSRVKVQEDTAKAPVIGKDGSGLYATLYAIKKQESRGPRRHRLFPRGDRSSYPVRTNIETILEYTQLANDTIAKIDVDNDPFDNQLRIRIWIEGKNEATVLPLSAMSDGTIKWLSLITIILTTRSIFSIEEPENYLHPIMQAEIIKVMRSTMKPDRFILLSTHSETILNNATPDEVLVTSFRNGVTTAKRPAGAVELGLEIQKTGFGLGYYYIAGSLDDE